MIYRVWENKDNRHLVLRPEGTELRDTYWQVVASFDVEDRAQALEVLKEAGITVQS